MKNLCFVALMLFSALCSFGQKPSDPDYLHSVIPTDAVTGFGGDFFFWNDITANGQYYPNWRINFAASFTHADLTDRSIDYVIKRGETVVKDAVVNPSSTNTDFMTAYAGPFEFEAGDYTITYSFNGKLNEADVHSPAYTQSFIVKEIETMTASYVGDHTFADLTASGARLSGVVNVKKPEEGWKVRIIAAGAAGDGLEGVEYPKFGNDIIWGETTIEAPVAGENSFTVQLTDMPKGATNCWMKLLLVKDGETDKEMPGGGAWTKPLYVEKVNMTASYVNGDYAFNSLTEHGAILTGSVNVVDPAAGWKVRVVAAGAADDKLEGVDYTMWGGDVIWGETTIDAPVAGTNDFRIVLTNMPSAQTNCWMKLQLVKEGENAKTMPETGPWAKPLFKLADPTLAYATGDDSYSYTVDEEGTITIRFKYNYSNPDNANVSSIRFGAVTAPGTTSAGEPGGWPGDGGNLVGSCELNSDFNAGVATMTVSGLEKDRNIHFYMKSMVTLADGTVINGGNAGWNIVVRTAGTPVNTVKYSVMEASYTYDASDPEKRTGFEWSCPRPNFTDPNFNGLTGDYVGGGFTRANDIAKAWAGNINVEMNNDVNGCIFGTATFEGIGSAENADAVIYINNIEVAEADYDAENGVLTFKSSYTYVNERVASWKIVVNYSEGVSQTRTFPYTVKNCSKTQQSITISELATEVFGWDKVNTTSNTIGHFGNVAIDPDNVPEGSDWTHTAWPVDVTENDGGEFWNPTFNYIIANEVSEDGEDSHLVVALRFDNGTLIPTDFHPQILFFDENGMQTALYELKPVPNVINMFAYPEVDGSTIVQSRANADIPTIDAGKYDYNFHISYLSVKAGNGYSSTKRMPLTVVTDQVTTDIETIGAADDTAPVEYFTLQGIRVDNPAAGTVVIRRQGNSVSKILVK